MKQKRDQQRNWLHSTIADPRKRLLPAPAKWLMLLATRCGTTALHYRLQTYTIKADIFLTGD